jgi:SAM-dependent methyltransferase
MSESFEAVKARHRLAWGLNVENYVRHAQPELGAVADQLLEFADPAWGAQVIDVGCGPGTLTIPAARRVGPGGHVTGVDLAAPMLAWAERTAARDAIGNLTLVEGDCESLHDLPDCAFDVGLSNFGVIFAPRPEATVAAVARVLKPGGVFALSVWLPEGEGKSTFEFIASVTPPPPPGAATPDSWGEPGVAAARLATHFDAVEERRVSVLCDYPSVDDAWRRMKEGRPPFAMAYGRMSHEQRLEVEEKVRANFRRLADENGRVQYVRAAALFRGVRRV